MFELVITAIIVGAVIVFAIYEFFFNENDSYTDTRWP
jgi:hypothetical protein